MVSFQPNQLKPPRTIRTQLAHDTRGKNTNSGSLKISDKITTIKIVIAIPKTSRSFLINELLVDPDNY